MKLEIISNKQVKTLNVKVPYYIYHYLFNNSANYGYNVSALVREIISQYLKSGERIEFDDNDIKDVHISFKVDIKTYVEILSRTDNISKFIREALVWYISKNKGDEVWQEKRSKGSLTEEGT